MVNLSAIGGSKVFLDLLNEVSHLAKINRPVLILGERGTGKELVAHRLHYLSNRWEHPLISLNCGALSSELLSGELFGHEKGAFTGAQEQRKGRIERAEGGSLFLDELATSEANFQEHLLRVLEVGEYERLGGVKVLKANVRFIAATNLSPEELYEGNVIRKDLLDRLSFATVMMPPLRNRIDDIPLLVEHFSDKFTKEMNWDVSPVFSEDALEELSDYAWPGNIRELKNIVERSLYASEGDEVDSITWSPFSNLRHHQEPEKVPGMELSKPESSFPISIKSYLNEEEKQLMLSAYKEAKGHHKTASELLDLTYHQWRALIKKHDLKNIWHEN